MALLRFPPSLTYITSLATFRYLQETIFLVISIPCILIVGYLGFKKENIFVEIPPTICTATRQRLSGGVFLQLNHIHPVSSGTASAPSRDHQSTATCEAATRNLTGIVHEAALREGYGEEACVCLFKMDATEENKRVSTGIEAKKPKTDFFHAYQLQDPLLPAGEMSNANTSNIYLHSKTPVSKRFVKASCQLLTRRKEIAVKARSHHSALKTRRADGKGGERTRSPLGAASTPRSHSA